ncbi:hypothetical protein HBA_0216 [Sodalis endosymbiont of Henestaris halophilus]|nr:hypothetical protein HBA_0216 [Sodalis endosymbiont of Henestaris halophilus]
MTVESNLSFGTENQIYLFAENNNAAAAAVLGSSLPHVFITTTNMHIYIIL